MARQEQQRRPTLTNFASNNQKNAKQKIKTALADPSSLFRHDVAFCLGQRQDPACVAALSALLGDGAQHPMVRHEAAEALGAIAGADGEGGGADEAAEAGAGAGARAAAGKREDQASAARVAVEAACRAKLREHLQDACQEVRETCELALARIEHVERERECRRREQQQQQQQPGETAKAAAKAACPPRSSASSFQESPYFSVDPTPALPSTTPLPELTALLADPARPVYERYQALFALRNRGGADSVSSLCAALRTRRGAGASALLRHEVAYVLGQMQSPDSVRALRESLADAEEHPMVRHEAAEALGAVAGDGGGDGGARETLSLFASDPELIVAESCAVALDVAEHEAAGEFEYADLGTTAATVATTTNGAVEAAA